MSNVSLAYPKYIPTPDKVKSALGSTVKSLLTVQEAAIYLRVNRSTVWRWCKDGTLTSAFKIGRNWRIHRSEVEKIIGQKLEDLDSGKAGRSGDNS